MSRVKVISSYFIGIPLFVPGGSHTVSEQGVFGSLVDWRNRRGRRRELLDQQVCGPVSAQSPAPARLPHLVFQVPVPRRWHRHPFDWAGRKPASSCGVVSLIHRLHTVTTSFLSCLVSSSSSSSSPWPPAAACLRLSGLSGLSSWIFSRPFICCSLGRPGSVFKRSLLSSPSILRSPQRLLLAYRRAQDPRRGLEPFVARPAVCGLPLLPPLPQPLPAPGDIHPLFLCPLTLPPSRFVPQPGGAPPESFVL